MINGGRNCGAENAGGYFLLGLFLGGLVVVFPHNLWFLARVSLVLGLPVAGLVAARRMARAAEERRQRPRYY